MTRILAMLVTGALALPGLSRAQPLSVVPVQTSAEREGFARRYPDAARLMAHKAVIPGLEDGYVPQGIAWLDHGKLVIQSHYATDKKRPTLLTVVDLDDGKLVCAVALRVKGASGMVAAYRGHAGGIAVLDGHVWVGSGGKIMRFPAGPLIPAKPARQLSAFSPVSALGSPPPDALTSDAEFDVDSRASFISADRATHTLWVGDYHRADNPDYSTPDHHTYGPKHAWVAAYRMDATRGVPLATVKYAVEGKNVLRPDAVVFIRDGVQGMANLGGEMALSVSEGSDDSKLALYRSPLGGPGFSVPLKEGRRTTGYVLEDANWLRTLHLPASAEDLEWTGDRLLVTFESAAAIYREKRRAGGGFVEDHCYSLRAP